MFCEKCGTPTEEGGKFCMVCGANLTDDTAAQTPQSQQSLETVQSEQNANNVVQEYPVSQPHVQEDIQVQENPSPIQENPSPIQEIPQAPIQEHISEVTAQSYVQSEWPEIQATTPVMSGEQKPKKRKKSLLVTIAIILAILVPVGAAAAVFYEDIWLMVSPKTFLTTNLNRTMKTLTAEIEESNRALFGAPINSGDSGTFEVSASIDTISAIGDDMPKELSLIEGLGFKLGSYYNKEKPQMIVNAALTDGDTDMASMDGYINDDEMGLRVPEISKDFITAPTKTFGQAWNESELGDTYKLGEDLDLSLTNLQKMSNKKLTDKTKKSLEKAFNDLIKSADVGKTSKGKMDIGGKEQTVRNIPTTISKKDMQKYMSAVIDTYLADDSVKEAMKLQELDEDMIKQLKDSIGEMPIGDSIGLNFVSYRGKIVAVSLQIDVTVEKVKVGVKLDLRLTGADKMINDISLEASVNMIVKGSVKYSSKGNHVPKDGKYTDTTNITVIIPSQANMTLDSNCEIDLNKKTDNISGKLNIKAPIASEAFDASLEYAGSYDNSQGMDMKISKWTTSFNGMGNSINASGDLNVKRVAGDSGKTIDTSGPKVKLSDLKSYMQKPEIVLNAQRISDKITQRFDPNYKNINWHTQPKYEYEDIAAIGNSGLWAAKKDSMWGVIDIDNTEKQAFKYNKCVIDSTCGGILLSTDGLPNILIYNDGRTEADHGGHGLTGENLWDTKNNKPLYVGDGTVKHVDSLSGATVVYGAEVIGESIDLGLNIKVTEPKVYGIAEGTKLITPLEYNMIKPIAEEVYAAKKDGKAGYIDKDNKVTMAFMFDETDSFNNGIAAVKLGGLWGFIRK